MRFVLEKNILKEERKSLYAKGKKDKRKSLHTKGKKDKRESL